MNKFRISPGIHSGMSCFIFPFDALKTMDMSDKTSASQVTIPRVKSKRMMAFVLTGGGNKQKNKPILRLAYNYRNNHENY